MTDAGWPGAHRAMRVPISGGKPHLLTAGGPSQLAIEGPTLYWSGAGGLMRMPLEGGASNPVWSEYGPSSFAIDGASLYWTHGTGQKEIDIWVPTGGVVVKRTPK